MFSELKITSNPTETNEPQGKRKPLEQSEPKY